MIEEMLKLQNKKNFEDYVLDAKEKLSKILKEKKVENFKMADSNIFYKNLWLIMIKIINL